MALDAIIKVIRAVEFTILPEAPENLSGLINLGGEIIPVLDVRKRFHLPNREIDLDDRIIICKGFSRTIAFMADVVEGVVEFASLKRWTRPYRSCPRWRFISRASGS